MAPASANIRLDDISRGGAQFSRYPALRQGTTGMLIVNQAAVPFIVLRTTRSTVQVKFTETLSDDFESTFDDLVTGKEAIAENSAA